MNQSLRSSKQVNIFWVTKTSSYLSMTTLLFLRKIIQILVQAKLMLKHQSNSNWIRSRIVRDMWHSIRKIKRLSKKIVPLLKIFSSKRALIGVQKKVQSRCNQKPKNKLGKPSDITAAKLFLFALSISLQELGTKADSQNFDETTTYWIC